MSEYFPKPNSLGVNVKGELGLSNYATKIDLKNAAGVDTLSIAKKTDLANLRSDVDKLDLDKLKNVTSGLSSLKSKVDILDVDKLVPVPVDLSKLSDIVKTDVVKKDVYNAKMENIEDKIPNITNLATKTTLNAKINEGKGERASITNLATTALTAVENKMPNVNNLVKRTDYKTNVSEIEKKITDHDHDNYITTPEFNKLTAENFAARLAQANVATKSDIVNFVDKTDFDDKLKNLNKKVASNKTKHLLVENELKKLQPFDSSLFIGQSHFNNDGLQLFLIFQPTIKTIIILSGSLDKISE